MQQPRNHKDNARVGGLKAFRSLRKLRLGGLVLASSQAVTNSGLALNSLPGSTSATGSSFGNGSVNGFLSAFAMNNLGSATATGNSGGNSTAVSQLTVTGGAGSGGTGLTTSLGNGGGGGGGAVGVPSLDLLLPRPLLMRLLLLR